MAMVKLGEGVENISGGVGGDIFRWDQCRQHVQAKGYVPPIYNRPRISGRTHAFSRCMRYFFHVLTNEQRKEWWRYSYRHPEKNKKGETVYLQAHMSFISVNLKRLLAGKDFLIIPPP